MSIPDYTQMDDADVIRVCDTDAQKWADALAQHMIKRYRDIDHIVPFDPEDPSDVNWLMGWFANAIERARISSRGQFSMAYYGQRGKQDMKPPKFRRDPGVVNWNGQDLMDFVDTKISILNERLNNLSRNVSRLNQLVRNQAGVPHASPSLDPHGPPGGSHDVRDGLDVS